MSVYKKVIIKDLKGSFKYPIFIGRDIINQIRFDFQKQIKNKKVFLIYDDFFSPTNKASNPVSKLNKIISEVTISLKVFPVKSRDTNKNFKKLQSLIEKMLFYKIDRDSVIITFGGGVIGDIGGFAASILLRGINYIQMPTTLLAQVDSSVGGKTGINTKLGKNLVGAFHQPTKVIIDTSLISTLPKRELYAGFAEVIKYSLICDKNFFQYLDLNYKKILMVKQPFLEDLIFKSCLIKSKIVSQDEKEKGVRAFLNLGHTFGHAFEALLNYKNSHLIHGEAVAIGICMAFRLSEKLNLCSKDDEKLGDDELKEKLKEVISNVAFRTEIKDSQGQSYDEFRNSVLSYYNSIHKDQQPALFDSIYAATVAIANLVMGGGHGNGNGGKGNGNRRTKDNWGPFNQRPMPTDDEIAAMNAGGENNADRTNATKLVPKGKFTQFTDFLLNTKADSGFQSAIGN